MILPEVWHTIDIEVCTVNNSTPDYAGIYKNLKYNGVVPHIRLTAHVPFTFLFGTIVGPSATMDIDVFHDTVAVGD